MFFNGLKIPEFPVAVLKLEHIFPLNDFLAPLETVFSPLSLLYFIVKAK